MAGDSAPLAPTDRDAMIDRSVFVAQVEPLVDRAHDVAHGIVGDADVATDVVRDVFDSLRAGPALSPTGGGSRLESVLLATRAAALHRAASTGTSSSDASSSDTSSSDTSSSDASPTGTSSSDTSSSDASPTEAPAPDTASADAWRVPTASRNRVRLTRAAAAVLGADDTSTLELHLRHGIGAGALAGVLGVSADDAPSRLAQLRLRLDDALAAFTVWRGGEPACAELAALLDDGTTLDPAPFDAVAFDTVVAHRAACDACTRLHEALTNPAGMLVAAPVVAVPAAVRAVMLPPAETWMPAGAAQHIAAHRRASDDTPTALLWSPVDRPARSSPPLAEVRRDGRWPVIAASAAALLVVVAGGAAIAVRSPSGDDRPATTAAGVLTGDLADTTEVRSLGPPPPVVDTTGAATSTRPADTTESTEPEDSAPDTNTTEGSNPAPSDPAGTDPPSVVAPIARPPAPLRPTTRVAVTTTAPPGPTTTQPDVDTGIPPLPPPPTTAAPTTTAVPETTPAPATSEPATSEPATSEPATSQPPTTEPPTTEPTTTEPTTTEP